MRRSLQRRAARHGRSMEEEVRDILRNAVNEQDAAAGGLGTTPSVAIGTGILTCFWGPA